MNFLEILLSVILESILTAVFLAIIYNPIQDKITENKYGRWVLKVMDGTQELDNFPLTANEAKDFHDKPTQLAIFLKGKASPYIDWNCDPLSIKARECGLVNIDESNRVYTIDIAKGKRKKTPETRSFL
ncbi:MAG: hypothetical protein WA110_08945 [Anaerolineaceae bacterium]